MPFWWPFRQPVFDAADFCSRHIYWRKYNDKTHQVYTVNELNSLLDAVIEALKMDGSLVSLDCACSIVGDINGQYRDLIRILWMTDHRLNEAEELSEKHLENCKCHPVFHRRFMFLGNYIGTSNFSLECICTLFSLKILYPKQYILLRGIMETKEMNYKHKFHTNLIDRFGEKNGNSIWEKFNVAFSWMPLAGIIGEKILCMHGGISSHLKSLDDIRKIQRPLMDISSNLLAVDLLWSDPMDDNNIEMYIYETPVYAKNEIHGKSCQFNNTAIINVSKKLNVALIVRSHQWCPLGFQFSYQKKMATIFSAPNFLNNNMGGILRVGTDGGIIAIVIKSYGEPERSEKSQSELV